MYVEPRKMVQMNRFAGQKMRQRCREQTYGHQEGKTAGGLGGEKKEFPQETASVNYTIGKFRVGKPHISFPKFKQIFYRLLLGIQARNTELKT